MKFDEPLDSEDEELPTLSAGYILGDRYRIIEVRGRTRHNVLYNARHTETGRSFVVKKPRSRDRIEKLRGEGVRAITAREQVIEGVVSVFDTGEHGGIPYLVMEEVKGDDIRQLRKQKTFDPREVVRIYEKVVRTIKGYSGGWLDYFSRGSRTYFQGLWGYMSSVST